MPELTIAPGAMNATLSENIALIKYSPTYIQRTVLEHLETVSGGRVDIVDPTNPFIFLLEASCVNTAVSIQEAASNLRKQYPVHAQDIKDIYRHMSDSDFDNTFSIPAKGVVEITYVFTDLYNKAVLDPVSNRRKLVIARDTNITMSGTVLRIGHPINIHIGSDQKVFCKFDLSKPSKIHTSENMEVDSYVTVDANGVRFLTLVVPVTQLSVNSSEHVITNNTSFTKDILVTDNYHNTEVFIRNGLTDDQWTPIGSTHSPDVYDADTPTAVLKLVDNVLNVSIPSIYVRNNSITGNLRIDVYSTKGDVELNLKNIPNDQYVISYDSLDVNDVSQYTAPMAGIGVYIRSGDFIRGGRGYLPDNVLIDRVKTRSLSRDIPITDKQLEETITDKGLTITKLVDTVGNNIYVVHTKLISPESETIPSKANTTYDVLIDHTRNIRNKHGVYDNIHREQFTISNETLFEENNGIISFFSKDYLDSILAMPKLTDVVSELNKHNLYYTPFYHIVDYKDSRSVIRVVDLNTPEVSRITLSGINTTLDLVMVIDSINMISTDSGYDLECTVSTDTNADTIGVGSSHIELRIKDDITGSYYHFVSGSATGNVYTIQLDTNYAFDDRTNIILTNGIGEKDTTTSDMACNLTSNLEFYCIDSELSWGSTTGVLDDEIHSTAVTGPKVVISKTSAKGVMGVELKHLYHSSSLSVSPATYAKRTADLAKRYEEFIYRRDPETGSCLSFSTDCDASHDIIHARGDTVVDASGQTVYIYRKGDLILDDLGKPIVQNATGYDHHIGLFLIDASFLFSTGEKYVEYRNHITKRIHDVVTKDVVDINKSLLELTEIYLTSRIITGNIKVDVDKGLIKVISSKQELEITLYVDKNVIDTLPELNSLLRITSLAVNDSFESTSISRRGLEAEILAAHGEYATGVGVTGLAGGLDAFRIVTPGGKLHIGVNLEVVNTNEIIVSPDITLKIVSLTE